MLGGLAGAAALRCFVLLYACAVHSCCVSAALPCFVFLYACAK
jgi:hypothetical protein